MKRLWLSTLLLASASGAAAAAGSISVNPLRDAYYGDLHLHTSYSLDAYLIGAAKVDPDLAYRFAKGESIEYLGERAQRREPLDFLAVTDHAENIGVLNGLDDPNSLVSRSPEGRKLRQVLDSVTTRSGARDFSLAATQPGEADPVDEIWRDYVGARHNKLPPALQAVPRDAWDREIELANRHYEPGKFTSFIGYEWTSAANGANLHRNVIFKGDAAPAPFTAFDSRDPRDLWSWLESIRHQGFEALAIPHNGNASNGLMYDWVSGYEYMDRAYAQLRQANEPLSEIAQGKGQSETHPLLSPNDEFAHFEIFDYLENARRQVGRIQGSYLRDALSAGLVLQRQIGANPFKYGFVGGSDQHSGLSVSAQADFGGSHWKVNLGGGRPTGDQVVRSMRAATTVAAGTDKLELNSTSGNLTGVWAESNTRESIYDALRRRETFATSGTRLRFRVFGGWDLPADLLERRDWVSTGYSLGVPMGGDLPALRGRGRSPGFAIWAVKDPNGAPLDRVQVIKVWEDAGRQHEKIFDVARSSTGATELTTLWRDPEFDSRRAAAYYLRVLEKPTPRWSTLLAAQYGLPPPEGVQATVQQRGWSSPIWYTPLKK